MILHILIKICAEAPKIPKTCTRRPEYWVLIHATLNFHLKAVFSTDTIWRYYSGCGKINITRTMLRYAYFSYIVQIHIRVYVYICVWCIYWKDYICSFQVLSLAKRPSVNMGTVNILLLSLSYRAPNTAQQTILLRTDNSLQKQTRRRKDFRLSDFRFTTNTTEIQSSTLLYCSVQTLLQAIFWKRGVKCVEYEA